MEGTFRKRSGSDSLKEKETQEAETNNPEQNDKKKGKKEKEKEEKPPAVSLGQLFRYATSLDVVFMIIGSLGAIAHGVATPIQFIIFGDLIDAFIDFEKMSGNFDLEDKMAEFALYYVYLAIGLIVVGYLQMALWGHSAERQTRQMRQAFFRSVLKQDIGWFDTSDPGQLNNRLTEDLNKVNDGIGHKISSFIQAITMFLTGFILGFVYGWKLTLVILAITPLLAISGAILGQVLSAYTTKELDAYAKSGSIAEEVLSSVRTVAAYSGEQKEYERYSTHLEEARAYGIRKGLSTGLGMGFFNFVALGSYSLAFWYGSKLILDNEMTAGNMLIVFFSVVFGAMFLGQAGPYFSAIATAQGAAYQVFAVIDRVPPFDSSSENGKKPDSMEGNIEFQNIHFSYPSRPDVKILNGLNLTVDSGQTVALVGESGCGKSTVVKLIQRFYDPSDGMVVIDGQSIPTLNIKWLRQHVGVVSQEPVLFATTIAENIRYGKDGITQQEIEEACKMANAHDFISRLPQKYETLVGERGTQLSGGQKQRIAIARALVKDPKILLLDEATSALDTESESVVQAALDKARLGRTTIVIAHRLSTVRNADVIVAIQDGLVVEKGTHAELMKTEGVYRQLVTLQTFEEGGEVDAEENPNNEKKETGAAMKFMRSMSSMSSGSEGEGTEFERKLSRRASQRLSGKRRPKSALEKPDDNAKDNKEEDIQPAAFTKILKLNLTEWPYLIGGSIGGTIYGLLPLAFAVVLSEILTIFTGTNRDEIEKESIFWSLMFLVMGAVTCIGNVLQDYMFGVSGEALTIRLRKMAFQAMLRQEMGFFDDPAHSTGILTTSLATHASDVKGATGMRLGTIATGLSTAIACLIYSFYNSWKLTLLCIAFLPFTIVGSAVQMKSMSQGSSSAEDTLESGKVAVETIENIRTVVSLSREETFYEKYCAALSKPFSKAVRRVHLFGMSFGWAEATFFLLNAAAFRLGGYLVVKKELNMDHVLKVVLAISIGAMVLGQVSAFSPDYVKAKVAAARLFKLFDRVSAIDSSSEDGTRPSIVSGAIQLSGVRFCYPSRPDVKVLRGLDLTVKPGQKLALVGSSGCGKSTVISLLERFYDAASGTVTMDGSNVRSLNLKWLRAQMGIVSQEPVLFGCSIAENIAYGDNSRAVSMQEIEAAAKSANIHSFINSLPKGYDTLVGDKGTLISGGQKQRIAIARALIRNPRILLLDEATSALDTDSEKIVQEALDAASEGRTTIVIAHRLSTVQNADVIAVIDHGCVVELGSHQELLALKGTYHSLVTAQLQVGENGNK